MQRPPFKWSPRVLSRAAVALLAVASAASQAQPARASDFSRLVELSATRLDISRKVALTKWDSGAPIADPPSDPREKQVIDAAAEEARQRGLSTDLASAFFADQIEASKLIQFVSMATWRRSGKVPSDPRADLKSELRPALDKLKSQFIDALIATQALRESADCKSQLARSSASYVEGHRLAPLQAIALDRGLARVCGD
ncbi:MAG: chorismate mutase [Proteobacteria bacterium]|nr:chorismate mutase [Pseudomonadota bacterium]